MADNCTTSGVLVRRALAAVAVVALVGSLAQAAVAEPTTKQKLEAARHEFERLKDQIAAQQQALNRLQLEAARIAERFEVAYGRWEQITEELRNTRNQLQAARDEYRRLQGKLETRARSIYISGPGTGVEFVLGATSLADLSARVEYMDALSQEDADLATQVQNLKNQLAAEASAQERLQAKAADALAKVRDEKAALEAKLDEAQDVYDDLNAKKARAEELVRRLEKRYQRELEALTGVRFFDGIFKVCPVDQPRAVYDGFGAPRFAGGYHPHAGNDIIAPQGTPIRATFDGYARASYNGLGGSAVYVYGSQGYTYNAHLTQTGFTGSVSAGDIVGYVGATGDTATPHDHFEWHPNVIPDNWPASPYGYSVIGSAINPFPLLSQVC